MPEEHAPGMVWSGSEAVGAPDDLLTDLAAGATSGWAPWITTSGMTSRTAGSSRSRATSPDETVAASASTSR